MKENESGIFRRRLTRAEQAQDLFRTLKAQYIESNNEVMNIITKSKSDIFYKSVSFVISILSIVGIVAGFGFTAFNYIESILLFFVGEFILLFSIIYGIIWIKKIYEEDFNRLHDFLKKQIVHQEKMNNNFSDIEKIFANEDFDDDVFMEKISTITPSIDIENKDESMPRKIFPKGLYEALLIGSFILFLSFFVRDLIYFLFCS